MTNENGVVCSAAASRVGTPEDELCWAVATLEGLMEMNPGLNPFDQ